MTEESLTELSDGALADYLYHAIDDNFPDDDHPDILAIEAEMQRRGLDRERLAAAWQVLHERNR